MVFAAKVEHEHVEEKKALSKESGILAACNKQKRYALVLAHMSARLGRLKVELDAQLLEAREVVQRDRKDVRNTLYIITCLIFCICI
jgi:hypothetical protein